MLSVHRKVWFLVLLYHLLSWKHATAVKIINTFGNGVQSYGLSRDRDFGTKAIKLPTKHNEVISSMCHGVRLALLIPKLFLF